MSHNIPRQNIVDEPDISKGDVTTITFQVDNDQMIQQLMEMSSLMEKDTFTVTDHDGPLYQFNAFANIDMGSQPTRAVLTIHGPITKLR